MPQINNIAPYNPVLPSSNTGITVNKPVSMQNHNSQAPMVCMSKDRYDAHKYLIWALGSLGISNIIDSTANRMQQANHFEVMQVRDTDAWRKGQYKLPHKLSTISRLETVGIIVGLASTVLFLKAISAFSSAWRNDKKN